MSRSGVQSECRCEQVRRFVSGCHKSLNILRMHGVVISNSEKICDEVHDKSWTDDRRWMEDRCKDMETYHERWGSFTSFRIRSLNAFGMKVRRFVISYGSL